MSILTSPYHTHTHTLTHTHSTHLFSSASTFLFFCASMFSVMANVVSSFKRACSSCSLDRSFPSNSLLSTSTSCFLRSNVSTRCLYFQDSWFLCAQGTHVRPTGSPTGQYGQYARPTGQYARPYSDLINFFACSLSFCLPARAHWILSLTERSLE